MLILFIFIIVRKDYFNNIYYLIIAKRIICIILSWIYLSIIKVINSLNNIGDTELNK